MDMLWVREMNRCSRIIFNEEDDLIKRQCLKKKDHTTEESANKEVIRLAMKFYDKNQSPIKSYKCDYCDYYHVGRYTKQ